MQTAPEGFAYMPAVHRGRALAMTVAVHALALFLFLISTGSASPARPPARLAAFDLSQPGPPEKEVKAPQPKKVPPRLPDVNPVPPPAIELQTLSPLVVALLDQADAQMAGGGCDLTAPVQAALRESAEVREALPTIPAERRSVANALAIWNQSWIEADPLFREEVLEAIRTTAVMTIEAASDDCRLQPQAGPRLIYLPGKAETTVLALGSGTWTWQQVADSAKPALALLDGEQAGMEQGTGSAAFWETIFKR